MVKVEPEAEAKAKVVPNAVPEVEVVASESIISSFLSKLGLTGTTVISIGLCSLGIIIYIAMLIVTSNYTSSPDEWAKIKKDISTMWILSLFAMLFFIIAAFLLYKEYPKNAVYISLLVSCVALGLSFNALAISAIRK